MNNKLLQFWVIIGFVAMFVINYLATSLPLNGISAPELADYFEIYFIPANYAFAIWSIIFLGMMAFTIYQALPKHQNHPIIAPIRWAVGLNFLVNGLWVVVWHYKMFVLSVPIMFGILGTLIYVYIETKNHRTKLPTVENLLVHVAFSIYMGWISVASIVNVASVAWWVGWKGSSFSQAIWTAVMLVVAVVLAYLVARSRGDVPYLLVFVWAFVAIASDMSANRTQFAGIYPDASLVVIAASIAAVAVTLLIVMVGVGRMRRTKTFATA